MALNNENEFSDNKYVTFNLGHVDNEALVAFLFDLRT